MPCSPQQRLPAAHPAGPACAQVFVRRCLGRGGRLSGKAVSPAVSPVLLQEMAVTFGASPAPSVSCPGSPTLSLSP